MVEEFSGYEKLNREALTTLFLGLDYLGLQRSFIQQNARAWSRMMESVLGFKTLTTRAFQSIDP